MFFKKLIHELSKTKFIKKHQQNGETPPQMVTKQSFGTFCKYKIFIE